jgi:hypothetical protein
MPDFTIEVVYRLREYLSVVWDFAQFTGNARSGLARKSKGGRVLQVAWPEVHYVYPLSQAFLLVKAAGGIPVPYQCLSGAQRAQLDDFFAGLNAARRAA